MKKKDLLFFIVTIVLLPLFSGIVITGVIRKESFCLMICLIAGLLLIFSFVYLLLPWKEEKANTELKKQQYEKLEKIFAKIKFPEDKMVDIETITTKTGGDKESIVTTRKRNLNAELCKKWIDSVVEL